jgi:hypothetical protein
VSFLLVVCSPNGVAKAVIDALSVVYDEEETAPPDDAL